MRLLGVELDRFLSRPAVRWIIVAVLALAASAALLALGPATPMSEAERAQVVADFESYHDQWLADHEELYEDCLAGEAVEREVDPDVDWECEWALQEPQITDWFWETTFAESGHEILRGVTLGVLFGLAVAVVSFVAAEFSTGAIGNWLTFEPRRVRVYLAKLGAAVIGAGVLAGIAYVIAVFATYLPFAAYATTGEVTAVLWEDLAAGGARFALAGALVAVIAVALAFLLRHLAAAIGVAIGWLVIVELTFAAVSTGLQRWTMSNNLRALTEGGTVYHAEVCSLGESGRRVCEWTEFPISALQGGLVLGGVAVVLTVVALLVFRRRDVS